MITTACATKALQDSCPSLHCLQQNPQCHSPALSRCMRLNHSLHVFADICYCLVCRLVYSLVGDPWQLLVVMDKFAFSLCEESL